MVIQHHLSMRSMKNVSDLADFFCIRAGAVTK